ncbi:hypothetical protein FB567DRAFT_583159 [Paraphoma chrysanthemicola]|uniref:Uncharacterized protein n=1 Tax=Paraphoma chrysanthemicola TaxID=798071 RepID=A0A8K0QX91_9PLEO|nr:hypothetical protein FB567DRAFT_583159 [Paraphoma chrysanthemicola]
MEVAGLVLTAVAFVDQAIKSGTVLARLSREYPEAQNQISNAALRLEAQRYTLKLWYASWAMKAEPQRPAALADKFRVMWGDKGYDLILKCLTQLNARFGEALRTLRSIDPSSLQATASEPESRPLSMLSPNPSLVTPESSQPSLTSSTTAEVTSTDSHGTKSSKSRTSKFFSEKRKSTSLKFWKKPSKSTSSAKTPPSPAAQVDQVEQAREIREQRLSPGAKFKWSLGLKDELRLLITEIDDWLEQLQTLSVRCFVAERTTIQARTRRADSTYFDNILGPIAYIDHTNSSFKFPLLITSGEAGTEAYLLIAEAILPERSTLSSNGNDKIRTMEEIRAALKNRTATFGHAAVPLAGLSIDPMLLHTSQVMIVLHEVPGIITKGQNSSEPIPRCTFLELLSAESAVDPFIARWKRIQLAFIIALSVLHLYETGWLSEQLEMADFQFFGTANSQYVESSPISPYVSPTGPKAAFQTPFDCLKMTGDPQSFLGARDTRLATLFYSLGIVLFELGRGIDHKSIHSLATLDLEPSTLSPEDADTIRKSRVLKEIEKIPFGRAYADLVKYCLTGRLYATSKINVDGTFNDAVVENLYCTSIAAMGPHEHRARYPTSARRDNIDVLLEK